MKYPAVLSAATLLAVSAIHAASVELTDDRDGLTCEYYSKSAQLGWEQDGGDWLDIYDKVHGDAPYAAVSIEGRGGVEPTELDITRLVRKWQDGSAPESAVYLRQMASQKASVKFASREFDDSAMRPRVLITWDDGSHSDINPSADATVACSSKSGSGMKSSVEVGNDRSGVIVFPFAGKSGRRVADARLVLYVIKRYGKSSNIGVFQLVTPSSLRSEPMRGLSAGFQRDVGILSNPSVVFATRFDNPAWQSEWSAGKEQLSAEPILQDPENRFVPLDGQALKVTVPEGKKTGLNLLYKFREKTGSEPDAMYFRYYLRFADSWSPSDGGKLPGLAGTYNRGGWGGRRSDGTNGWSARGRYAISSALAEGQYLLASYVYYADMDTNYGSAWGWNLGRTGLVEKNRWYSVEQYVKLNTPGKSDGELKAWLNGEPIFERNDIRFRDTSDLHIEALWMDVYHGGTERAPKDISLYIDNIVLAHEYIGPGSGFPAQ